MNTPTTADEWAVYHCECFSITSPADVSGVISWGRTFCRAGISVLDLVAATDWMVVNVSPQWRREHLGHIQAHLQRIKLGRLADNRQKQQQGRTAFCAGCDDTGLIAVPHPRDITDGVWGEKYDCVVACPCARGDANVSAFADRKKQLRTLMSYEREFPHWRDMMFRKWEHRRAFQERDSEATVADKNSGPLRRLSGRVADSFRLPE